MSEEELRNKIIELEELNKTLDAEKKSALEEVQKHEAEIKVLKEYNKKLFERIPAVKSPKDADEQDGEPEPTKGEKIGALMNKLMEDF